ncbi:MAG: hypothetical protein ACJ763_10885 [Bdellovibrionia bacterium]
MISIQKWDIIPYESFGPLQLNQEVERWDLEDALGEPCREEKGKNEEIIFVFKTAEGEMKAVFTPNLEFEYLVLPQNAKMTTEIEGESIQLPPGSKELKNYLMASDPDSREVGFHRGKNLVFPRYGLSWDLESDWLCLYSVQ